MIGVEPAEEGVTMIRRAILVAVGVIVAGFIVGCEWEEITDEDAQLSKNSSTNGTAVVTTNADGTVTTNWVQTTTTNTVTVTNTVTTTNGTGTGTNGTGGATGPATTVPTEAIGTGVLKQSVYSGAFAHDDVKSGSVTIRAGGLYVFTDNGDGTLSGTAGATGTINYDTGAWSIDLKGADLPTGTSISATYQYYP